MFEMIDSIHERQSKTRKLTKFIFNCHYNFDMVKAIQTKVVHEVRVDRELNIKSVFLSPSYLFGVYVIVGFQNAHYPLLDGRTINRRRETFDAH